MWCRPIHEALESTGTYTVTAVGAHLDPAVVELTIDGERIETTPEHPFYITEEQWEEAGDLCIGADSQGGWQLRRGGSHPGRATPAGDV
jgi:hypothetical protein